MDGKQSFSDLLIGHMHSTECHLVSLLVHQELAVAGVLLNEGSAVVGRRAAAGKGGDR